MTPEELRVQALLNMLAEAHQKLISIFFVAKKKILTPEVRVQALLNKLEEAHEKLRGYLRRQRAQLPRLCLLSDDALLKLLSLEVLN